MAGDWIPIHSETPNKPEVLEIARKTGRSRDEVFGLLVRFWLWIQSVTVERYVRVSPLDICVTVGGDESFWEAVIDSGWIIKTDTGIEIPNADEWLSKGAKARLLNKERQQRHRDKHADKRNENVTLHRYENVTTEQKRIEENRRQILSTESKEKKILSTKSKDCSEPAEPASEPTTFTFAVVGPKDTPKTWVLKTQLYKTLAESYPAVDIDKELRAARAWCETNPKKRKTGDGMPRFLNEWMKSEQNRAGKPPQYQTRRDRNEKALDEFLGSDLTSQKDVA